MLSDLRVWATRVVIVINLFALFVVFFGEVGDVGIRCSNNCGQDARRLRVS